MAPAASVAAGGVLAFLLLPAMMLSQVAADPYRYKVESGMDFFGNDFRPSEGPTAPACGDKGYGEDAKACEARCNAAATCAGFTYVDDVKCCFIKNKMTNLAPNPRCISHSKTGYPGYTLQYQVDYPFNDIMPTSGAPITPRCGPEATEESVDACINRCDDTSACVGFVYVPSNNCCYIKNKLGASNFHDGLVTYIKTADSCSDLAAQCDWSFQGSRLGKSVPTFDLGNGKGDHAISPPVTYKNGQKVQAVNTNGGYTYTGPEIRHENQNQFYGSGAKVFYRTFDSPVNVGDYKGRCFSVRLTNIELEDGTNLNPGDGNASFNEARRCVVFATKAEEKGFAAV